MINFDIEKLKFDDKGLIPAIVVDKNSREVMMQAYMNKESLKTSIEKNLCCFYSRSRSSLWLKGETSGNYLKIVKISADCDFDSLLIVVEPTGSACHTGRFSCFFNTLYENDEKEDFSIDSLYKLLEERKEKLPENSYTTYLFKKGKEKILKKVGEEATEVIIAGTKENKEETIYEIADLTYHLLVLMIEEKINLLDIREELGKRHIIDHKIKQESIKDL